MHEVSVEVFPVRSFHTLNVKAGKEGVATELFGCDPIGLNGLPVVVVNPAQVRAFARALGQRAKTDPIDAGVIAHFMEATRPEVRALPDKKTRLLAEIGDKAAADHSHACGRAAETAASAKPDDEEKRSPPDPRT